MATILVTRRLPARSFAALQRQASAKGWAILQHDHEEPIPAAVLRGAMGSPHEAASMHGLVVHGDVAPTHVVGLLCTLSDAVPRDLVSTQSLQAISTASAGFNHVDVDTARERGIPVGFTPGVLAETTADLAVAALLSISRRLGEAAQAARSGEWTSWKFLWMCGADVHGSAVGIVGLGSIGAAIARRLHGFGCRVLYTGGSGPKPSIAEPLQAEYRELPDLLAQSDSVILACALNDHTTRLINADTLALMQSHAYLVNIARGEVVDQDALVDALTSGSIAGAALDVTTPEPLPTEHPLFTLPNALVLPHIGSASVATRTAITDMAVENLVAGLEGKPMLHSATV